MTTAQEPGQFVIMYSDQAEQNPTPIYSAHTDVISGQSATYPTGETLKAIPKVAENVIGQDPGVKGRLLVYFRSDAADIIESEDSRWSIPMILLNDQNQQIGRKILTQENMTGFTRSGTVDVTCAADVPARLAYWDVPRGVVAVMDPNGKIYAYLGDDS